MGRSNKLGKTLKIPIRTELEKPTIIAKLLKSGKCYHITTDNGEWVIYYQNKMPFATEHWGDAELLHRHIGSQTYHRQLKSEWNTGSGIVGIIQYILQHDYEYYTSDNCFIAGKVASKEEIIPFLSFADILKDLNAFIDDQIELPDFNEYIFDFLDKYFAEVELYRQRVPIPFYNEVKKIRDDAAKALEEYLSDMTLEDESDD